MNSLFYFACVSSFALLIKLQLSQPTNFIPFTFPILFPTHLEGRREWPGKFQLPVGLINNNGNVLQLLVTFKKGL